MDIVGRIFTQPGWGGIIVLTAVTIALVTFSSLLYWMLQPEEGYPFWKRWEAYRSKRQNL